MTDAQSSYKKQKKLSFMQFVLELPDFFALLVSAILSRSLLVVIDLFDSLGELLKSAVAAILSKKLSKDLRFEYNYGIGKIEAISALLCEGIIFFGMLLTLGLAVCELIFPEKPSDLLIYVVGLKVTHVSLDTFFLVKQRKISKEYHSAIVKANYASSIAALLFDSVTLVALLIVWLTREYPLSNYITPILSILLAIYLLVCCILRSKAVINEITDKTLPEDAQLKIMAALNRAFHRYSEFHAVKSRRNGDGLNVDFHISFASGTTFSEILKLREDLQTELNDVLGNCTVNIVVQDSDPSINPDR